MHDSHQSGRDDEPVIESAELQESCSQAFYAEELGPAMEARVMMHGYFDNAGAEEFELANEFDADGAGGGGEADVIDEGFSHEAEVAIDVGDSDAEQEAGEAVVEETDGDAVPRVLAAHFETVDEADVGVHGVEEERDLAGVVLAVAVGIKDELFFGGFEAGTKGSAVAAVDFMGNDAHVGSVLVGELLEDFTGVVVGAVVDDDDFVVERMGAEGGEGFFEESGEGGGVVVGGEEDGQAVREFGLGRRGIVGHERWALSFGYEQARSGNGTFRQEGIAPFPTCRSLHPEFVADCSSSLHISRVSIQQILYAGRVLSRGES